MKLRQKLAMVLAAAIVTTSVFPVATQAASWNHVQNVVAGNTYNNTLSVGFNSFFNNVSGTTTAGSITVADTIQNGYVINVDASDLTFDWEAMAKKADAHKLYANGTSEELTGDWSVDSRLNSGDVIVFKGYGTVVESTGIEVDYDHAEISVVYFGEDDEMQIVIGNGTGHIYSNDYINVDITYVAKEGNPSVTVSQRGSLPISTGTISVTALDAVTTNPFFFDMGDQATISVDGGALNDITLEEKAAEALWQSLLNLDSKHYVTSAGNKFEYSVDAETGENNLDNAYVELIKFELRTSGLEFRGLPSLKGDYGFNNLDINKGHYEIIGNKDEIRVLVHVNSIEEAFANSNNQRGDVVIKGLTVVPEGRNDGEDGTVVKVRVSSHFLDTATYDAAVIRDFTTVLTCDEPVDIIAGKEDAMVTVNLNELVPKAINTGDEITFSLNKGHIAKVAPVYNSYGTQISWENVTFADAIGDGRDGGGLYLDPLHDREDFEGTLSSLTNKSGNVEPALATIDDFIELPSELMLVGLSIDNDGFVVGFDTIATESFNSVDDPEKMEIEFNVGARLGEEGNVYLTAVNRGFDEDLVVKVADITVPVTAVAEQSVVLEAGMRMQAGGKIVVQEQYSAMLEKAGDNKLYIAVEPDGIRDGIRIEQATVLIDGVGAKYEVTNGTIIVEIERESDEELATIVVEDIVFTSTNVTPQGHYDVVVYGDAISDFAAYDNDGILDQITLNNFIQVGTDVRIDPVTTTINWRTGATTVNGEKIDLIVEPFVSANGRTMVGIRDIATFFNIPASQINFFNQPVDGFIYGQPVSQGTGIVQIVNGSTIVTFVNGSNIAIAGSQTLYMDEVMQIVDGRSYAPIRYVGEALGLTVTIDEATTTATFKNTAN